MSNSPYDAVFQWNRMSSYPLPIGNLPVVIIFNRDEQKNIEFESDKIVRGLWYGDLGSFAVTRAGVQEMIHPSRVAFWGLPVR